MRLIIEVSNKNLADTLCAGFEGGISYWAESYDPVGGEKARAAAKTLASDLGDSTSRYWHYCLPLVGGRLVVREHDKGASLFLTRLKIRKGLCLMALEHSEHLAGVLDPSKGDATTGDALIQLALFGELVYG